MSKVRRIVRMGVLAVTVMGALTPATVFAQTLPPAGVSPTSPQTVPTLGLTDAEKADVLSHNTEGSVDAARAGLGGSTGANRQIHGEMGVVVGTHGTRAMYGTAAIPLGANAGAVVSFETSHYGGPR